MTSETPVDEVDHVDECPADGCEKSFIGMTPDDVREHIREDHDAPILELYVWPTEEARRKHGRSVDTDTDRE